MRKYIYLFVGLICIGFGTILAQAASVEFKIIADDSTSFDHFGASADVYGDTIIVGAPEEGPSRIGAVYVFVRSGTDWVEQDKLTPSDGEAGDQFGQSVSIFENTAVVGAPYDDDAGSFSGSAYVFVRSGGVWSEQAKITASDGMAFDAFGYSVDIHDDTIIVGAPLPFGGATHPGAAYVFVHDGTWDEQDKLNPSDGAVGDTFGISVAVYENIAIAGASQHDPAGLTAAGAAYVFLRTGTMWEEEEKLIASDTASGDIFGFSLSLSGNTAVIGAPRDDDNGDDSGSAYIFLRTGSGWDQQHKLTASDGMEEDRFGAAVSVDGNTAVIGAFLYDQPLGATSDTYAYVFERDELIWIEKDKILTGSGSSVVFSYEFVGVCDCTAIVGTVLDDEAGTDAGAAYAYTLETCPCADPLTGMVSWWSLDELTPPTSNDREGSNDGTWVNDPIPTTGMVDGSLQFNGISNYVDVPNDPSLNFRVDQDFSIDAWIKPQRSAVAPIGLNGTIVDKRDPISGRGYGLSLVDGHLAFIISDGSTPGMSFVAPAPLVVDVWSFVAVTVDRTADVGTVYVNNMPVGSFTPSDTASGTIDNTEPFFIAKSSTDDFFYGAIDEVEVFDRALDQGEIEYIYSPLTGGKCKCAEPPDELVSWWPFDEIVGPISADIVGPNDGNQVGGPVSAGGKVDVALEFNGLDQHVKVADHDSLNFGSSKSFSIDAWVRPAAADSRGVIVDKLDPSTGVGYRLFILNQTLMFTIGDGSSPPFTYISPNLIGPGWSFVVVTVDRDLDLGTVYINNVVDGTFTLSTGAPGSISNTWPLFMGGNPSGDNFRGRLDEVEIYNKVLTVDEINEIYISDGKCKPEFDESDLLFLPLIMH